VDDYTTVQIVAGTVSCLKVQTTFPLSRARRRQGDRNGKHNLYEHNLYERTESQA
jgi:hypothetical protein